METSTRQPWDYDDQGKKQRDKKTWKVTLKVGDRVMVLMLTETKGEKRKLTWPLHSHFWVLTVTLTNAEVQLVDDPKLIRYSLRLTEFIRVILNKEMLLGLASLRSKQQFILSNLIPATYPELLIPTQDMFPICNLCYCELTYCWLLKLSRTCCYVWDEFSNTLPCTCILLFTCTVPNCAN